MNEMISLTRVQDAAVAVEDGILIGGKNYTFEYPSLRKWPSELRKIASISFVCNEERSKINLGRAEECARKWREGLR